VSKGVVRGVDLLAVAAAVVAAAMTGVYLAIMREQGDEPLRWVIAVLCTCAVLATYAAPVRASQRRTALRVSGVGLVALGLLAILTIGLPIMLAGALALLGSLRSASPAPVD
jgi:hypothetical protein